jgi:BirA family biotin operon repressor/biotin-[acetyl-CoA-carboxylase] ligase
LFSVALPLDPLPPALPAVTLACGVGVAEFLATRGIEVALKWPNDLRIDGCKLGGMLAEVAVDAEGRATLVIGIGLNVWLHEDDRLAIDQPAIALADLLPRAQLVAEREAWIGALACVVLQTVERFIAEGFVAFRARFNALLEARGELVEVVDDGRPIAKGRVIEVDTIGRLILRSGAGVRAINVGDVSVRKQADK